MLVIIKSYYFIEIIISYVNEEQKLKMIKYNKKLQKRINISIINYKHFKGKYIIYESNGKVKEYYSQYNNLAFEGEYLNGKRNGYGKKFWNGILMFEGEYLNGKRNEWDRKSI